MRNVASWYWPITRDLTGQTDFTSTTTNQNAYVELSASDRVEWVIWSNETYWMSIVGIGTNNTGAAFGMQTWIDASGGTVSSIQCDANPATALGRVLMTCPITGKLTQAEGHHFTTMAGRANGGGTFSASYGLNVTGWVGPVTPEATSLANEA